MLETFPRNLVGALSVLFVALTLASSAAFFLFPCGPNDKEAIAVQHWGEYGVLQMKAAFVVKPGPLTPAELENPTRFRGHFLFGSLPYHLLWLVAKNPFIALLATGWILVLATFAAIRVLPGHDDLKYIAFLAIWTCPGVLREFLSLDPVPSSLFWSIPALIWLCANFYKSTGSFWFSTSVLAAGAAMALNWTSSIALAIWSPVLLMGLIRSKWNSRLLLGFFAVGLIAAGVFGFLVWDKLHVANTAVAAGYLGGSSGYGAHASLVLSLKRITVACGIGLLPLWLCLGYQWWLRKGTSALHIAICLLPAALSMGLVLVLRNYASHAQWTVAMPIVLQGLVASVTAFFVLGEKESFSEPEKKTYRKLTFAALIGCALYAGGFILLFSAFAAQSTSNFGYVLKHTHPHDVLLLKDYDPTFGSKTESGFLMDITHQLTRESVAFPSPAAEILIQSGRRCFLFTKSAEEDPSIIRREADSLGADFLRPFFDWYQKRVSGQAKDALQNPENHWVLIPYPHRT